MEGKKHTFKVIYRFENQLGRRLEFSKRDKKTEFHALAKRIELLGIKAEVFY